MTNKSNAYFTVNLIFVLLIGIALGYSYFFYPNNHPIGCLVKNMTAKECSACGFSRAFSAFTHFEFTLGNTYNKNALTCYLFFMFQFVLRLYLVGITFFKMAVIPLKYVYTELIVTILFFLIAFLPLIL
jgi:hypothetical protein